MCHVVLSHVIWLQGCQQRCIVGFYCSYEHSRILRNLLMHINNNSSHSAQVVEPVVGAILQAINLCHGKGPLIFARMNVAVSHCFHVTALHPRIPGGGEQFSLCCRGRDKRCRNRPGSFNSCRSGRRRFLSRGWLPVEIGRRRIDL